MRAADEEKLHHSEHHMAGEQLLSLAMMTALCGYLRIFIAPFLHEI